MEVSKSMESSKVFLSIDLNRDYSQMSYCYSNNMTEPESVSSISGEQKYLIPTTVAKLNDSDTWVIGDEALLREKRGEAKAFGDIIKLILTEKSIFIEEIEYTSCEILKKFFEGMFGILKRNNRITNPDYVVITVEYPDRILVNVIRRAIENLGIEKDKIKVVGHSESLIYYMLFQKKELWLNDVLVFDFTKNQFQVRRFCALRARIPQPVVVEEMDLSSEFTINMTKNEVDANELDKMFLKLLRELCNKHIISSVYLTGVGFYEKWMKESIRFLCNKRRVFQGHNLFVKGACYAALSDFGIGNTDEYQFICSGRTLINIEMEVKKGDKDVGIVLSKAGTNWYEAGAKVEAILDEVSEIKLRINSAISKNSKEIVINLETFPVRPNKTTRVEIVLAYRTDRQCVIMVKDLGFGSFFKASGEIIKQIINVEEFI